MKVIQTHVWGSGQLYTELWLGKPEGKNHLEDPGADGRILLRWIYRKWVVGASNGSIWLRVGTSVGYL